MQTIVYIFCRIVLVLIIYAICRAQMRPCGKCSVSTIALQFVISTFDIVQFFSTFVL